MESLVEPMTIAASKPLREKAFKSTPPAEFENVLFGFGKVRPILPEPNSAQ